MNDRSFKGRGLHNSPEQCAQGFLQIVPGEGKLSKGSHIGTKFLALYNASHVVGLCWRFAMHIPQILPRNHLTMPTVRR